MLKGCFAPHDCSERRAGHQCCFRGSSMACPHHERSLRRRQSRGPCFHPSLGQRSCSHNITVNAVAPGTTFSARIRQLYTKEAMDAIISRVPFGRIAEPEEVADPILFLASDAARYITGVTIDVNGAD